MQRKEKPICEVYHWNPAAKDCYKRGGRCKGCVYNEKYFKPYGEACKMKYAVIALVRKLGIPNDLKRKESEIIC